MKARIELLICGLGLGSVLLASCGGGNGGGAYMPPPAPPSAPAPPVAPPAMTMDLDTAAVLAIIETKTSETAAPFQVDDAAVAVTPAGDETGAPVSVDAT
jgi:hypothetical protein